MTHNIKIKIFLFHFISVSEANLQRKYEESLASAKREFLNKCINKNGENSTEWQTKIENDAKVIHETKKQENYKASEVKCQSFLKELFRKSLIGSSVDERYSREDGLETLKEDIKKLKADYNRTAHDGFGPARVPVYEKFEEEEVSFNILT